jgi:hypothetical protein
MGNQGFRVNYPCYRKKKGPAIASGTSMIRICIHPAIIACPELFHEHGNTINGINLNSRQETDSKTGRFLRYNYFIHIRGDVIDKDNDICFQVISILESLTFNDVLHRPQGIDIYDLKSFFQDNFNRFFALDSFDFYSDLKEDDMRMLGKLNPDYPKKPFFSRYLSVLKVFNRKELLKHMRNAQSEDIENMEYPFRIVFSLNDENCIYLNILNLVGNYYTILDRYLTFLARKWLDHRHEVFEIVNEEIRFRNAPDLQAIIDFAKERNPRKYNLHETPSRPTLYEKTERNDNNFIAEFYSGK